MTPSEIRSILRELGGGANKRLGQHFLIDRSVLDSIVTAADIHPGELVLEIGPGLGVLTRALLAKGADVVAIEKDRRFVEYLNHPPAPSFSTEGGGDRLRVIHGDAATIHWHEIIGDRPWKLISNLPYSITSLALRKALWAPRPASRVVVLVQREVAERIVTTRKTSLLSLMVALASSSARILSHVPAHAFYPPPKVESAIFEIVPMMPDDREKRWGIDPEKIMALAKKGFTHPRKFLRSNLELQPTAYSLLPTENARAENLSPEQWACLAQHLS